MSKTTRKKSKSAKKAKSEAKKILTGYINQIALEQHDQAIMIDHEAVCCTKAEVLARHIWKSALGYTEEIVIVDKETGAVTKKYEVHRPDKVYVTMLYDRMEGRVPTVEVKPTDSKPSVAERVSKEGKNRLNNIAKG